MYTDNILACYMQSLNSEVANGKLWYADAKQAAQDIADKYELPLHVVVGVIAALIMPNIRSNISFLMIIFVSSAIIPLANDLNASPAF